MVCIKLIKNKRAFTLIELLVVIAVIAVIASIGIPVFAGQVRKAKQAIVDENARLIAHRGQTMITQTEADGNFVSNGVTLQQICNNLNLDATKVAEPVVRRAEMSNGIQVSETIMQITYTDGGYVGIWKRS